MKILVPLDGSSLADGILVRVETLLMREQSEIHLLRVLDGDEALADDGSELVALARRHLDACVAQLAARGETAHKHVLAGDPAERIMELAEELGVDLIAMATHGRTGVKRWVRGSVAERILRNSQVPVFLANPAGLSQTAQAERFKRILVPLDGSKGSTRILPLVVPFAYDAEAEIILLYCDRAGGPTAHPVPEVAKGKCQERAEALLAASLKDLELEGLKARIYGCYGDPADEIVSAIDRIDPDLVAMSSHGRSGISRWRFGSVAEKVLRQCSRPMLLRRMTRPKS